jgi:hypothetical protein
MEKIIADKKLKIRNSRVNVEIEDLLFSVKMRAWFI